MKSLFILSKKSSKFAIRYFFLVALYFLFNFRFSIFKILENLESIIEQFRLVIIYFLNFAMVIIKVVAELATVVSALYPYRLPINPKFQDPRTLSVLFGKAKLFIYFPYYFFKKYSSLT